MVPDEPGTVVVVIFPDNVFKYATSVRRHLPELFPAQQAAPNADPSPGEAIFGSMVAHARRSPIGPDNICGSEPLEVLAARRPDGGTPRSARSGSGIRRSEMSRSAISRIRCVLGIDFA
jgi:hypothetical protein